MPSVLVLFFSLFFTPHPLEHYIVSTSPRAIPIQTLSVNYTYTMKTFSLSIAALLATASMVAADVSVGQCAVGLYLTVAVFRPN